MPAHAIQDLLSRSGGSTYRLVRMASLRALELAEGRPAMVPSKPTDKLATIALNEVQDGLVVYEGVAEKVAAEIKAKEKNSGKS